MAELDEDEEDSDSDESRMTFVTPIAARDNKIKELEEVIKLQEGNSVKFENKAKKYKDSLENEIKKIVEEGGVSDDVASFVAKGYASTISDDDIINNQDGSLNISKRDFLKDVIDDDLNHVQKERFDYIVAKILRNLPNYVTKVPRRLSLSVKRPIEPSGNEANTDEKKQKSEKPKKEEELNKETGEKSSSS